MSKHLTRIFEKQKATIEAQAARIAELEGKLNVMEVDRDDWKIEAENRAKLIDFNDKTYKDLHKAKERIAELEAAATKARDLLGKQTTADTNVDDCFMAFLALDKVLKSQSIAERASIQTVANVAPVASDLTMLNVVVRSIKRYTTKHNEVMAVLTTDLGKIVVFPRSWYGYKQVITEAVVTGHMLLFATKPDNSKGVTQYILQHIEGIEPVAYTLPSFSVGQKVRIKDVDYSGRAHDVIAMMKNGHIWLEGDENIAWHASELEPYTESASDDTA